MTDATEESGNPPKSLLSAKKEPVLCRLCKATGMTADDETCCACKGQGQLHPEDVDEWTFADLDESLGPGAMGVQARRTPYVPPNAQWHTWMDDEDGRGYLWAELRATGNTSLVCAGLDV